MTRSASPRRLGEHLALALRGRRAGGRCPAAGAGAGPPPGGGRARRRSASRNSSVVRPPGGALGRLARRESKNDARPDVDHDGDRLLMPRLVVDQAHDVAQQRRRQVVDDEEAEVLELLGGGAAPGAGHAGDHDQLSRPGRRSAIQSSSISPVAVLTRGLAQSCGSRPLRDRLLDRGRRARPDAGHRGDLVDARPRAASSSEPKCLSSVLRRTSPRPGTSSSRLSTIDLERRDRWWVMANRWASSRTRWSR